MLCLRTPGAGARVRNVAPCSRPRARRLDGSGDAADSCVLLPVRGTTGRDGISSDIPAHTASLFPAVERRVQRPPRINAALSGGLSFFFLPPLSSCLQPLGPSSTRRTRASRGCQDGAKVDAQVDRQRTQPSLAIMYFFLPH